MDIHGSPIQWKYDFLEALRLGFSFSESMELVGLSVARLVILRKYDRAFDEEVTRIIQGRVL